jgi:hypothetical protein
MHSVASNSKRGSLSHINALTPPEPPLLVNTALTHPESPPPTSPPHPQLRAPYGDILRELPPFLASSSYISGAEAVNKSGLPPLFLKAVANTARLLGVVIGIKDGPDMPQSYSENFAAKSHPKPMIVSRKTEREGPAAGFILANSPGQLDEHGQPKPPQPLNPELFRPIPFQLTKSDFCYGLLEGKRHKYEVKELTLAEDGKTLKIIFSDARQKMPQGISAIEYSISLPLKPDQTLSGDDLNITDKNYPWLARLLDEVPADLYCKQKKKNINEGKQNPESQNPKSWQKVEIWGYIDGQQTLPVCSDADVFVVSVPHFLIQVLGLEISEVYNTADVSERTKMIDGIEKILDYLYIQATNPLRPPHIDEILAILTAINQRLSPGIPGEDKSLRQFATELMEDISKINGNPGSGTPVEIIVYHVIIAQYEQNLLEKSESGQPVHPLAIRLIQHCSESGFNTMKSDKVPDTPSGPVAFFFPELPDHQLAGEIEQRTSDSAATLDTESAEIPESVRVIFATDEEALQLSYLTEEELENHYLVTRNSWCQSPVPEPELTDDDDDDEKKMNLTSVSDSAPTAPDSEKGKKDKTWCKFFSRRHKRTNSHELWRAFAEGQEKGRQIAAETPRKPASSCLIM